MGHLIWIASCAAIGFALAVLATTLSKLFADEAKAWLPILADAVTRMAVARLPAGVRLRYDEEWRGHLHYSPGDLSKFILSINFWIAAVRIGQELRLPRRERLVRENLSRAAEAYKSGNITLAVKFHKRALRSKPKDPTLWVAYGHVLARSGLYTEAEAACYKAMYLDQQHTTNAHYLLSLIVDLKADRIRDNRILQQYCPQNHWEWLETIEALQQDKLIRRQTRYQDYPGFYDDDFPDRV